MSTRLDEHWAFVWLQMGIFKQNFCTYEAKQEVGETELEPDI
jgi:hypothetical protein